MLVLKNVLRISQKSAMEIKNILLCIKNVIKKGKMKRKGKKETQMETKLITKSIRKVVAKRESPNWAAPTQLASGRRRIQLPPAGDV